MSNEMIEKAVAAIEAQQKKFKEWEPAFMVGEQLKEIVRTTEGAAGLVAQDLTVAEMSLVKCEAKIRARADEIHKAHKGSGVCVHPREADEIIRKFYGIKEAAAVTPAPAEVSGVREESGSDFVDLEDFL